MFARSAPGAILLSSVLVLGGATAGEHWFVAVRAPAQVEHALLISNPTEAPAPVELVRLGESLAKATVPPLDGVRLRFVAAPDDAHLLLAHGDVQVHLLVQDVAGEQWLALARVPVHAEGGKGVRVLLDGPDAQETRIGFVGLAPALWQADTYVPVGPAAAPTGSEEGGLWYGDAEVFDHAGPTDAILHFTSTRDVAAQRLSFDHAFDSTATRGLTAEPALADLAASRLFVGCLREPAAAASWGGARLRILGTAATQGTVTTAAGATAFRLLWPGVVEVPVDGDFVLRADRPVVADVVIASTGPPEGVALLALENHLAHRGTRWLLYQDDPRLLQEAVIAHTDDADLAFLEGHLVAARDRRAIADTGYACSNVPFDKRLRIESSDSGRVLQVSLNARHRDGGSGIAWTGAAPPVLGCGSFPVPPVESLEAVRRPDANHLRWDARPCATSFLVDERYTGWSVTTTSLQVEHATEGCGGWGYVVTALDSFGRRSPAREVELVPVCVPSARSGDEASRPEVPQDAGAAPHEEPPKPCARPCTPATPADGEPGPVPACTDCAPPAAARLQERPPPPALAAPPAAAGPPWGVYSSLAVLAAAGALVALARRRPRKD